MNSKSSRRNFNTLIYIDPKWPDSLQKTYSKCRDVFLSESGHFGLLCIKGFKLTHSFPVSVFEAGLIPQYTLWSICTSVTSSFFFSKSFTIFF